jgi:hypothetical protein
MEKTQGMLLDPRQWYQPKVDHILLYRLVAQQGQDGLEEVRQTEQGVQTLQVMVVRLVVLQAVALDPNNVHNEQRDS